MKPGPELDRLVAEKVMGVKLDWDHDVWSYEKLGDVRHVNEGRGVYVSCKCGLSGYLNEVEPRRCTAPTCKPYSTDIAAAWEVIEKVPFTVQVRTLAGNTWLCEMWDAGGPGSATCSVEAEGPAPLAICLAALRAKGVDVEIEERLKREAVAHLTFGGLSSEPSRSSPPASSSDPT